MVNVAQATKILVLLGLADYEVSIYLSLLQKGEGTMLQVSRNTGIERTKLYRLIEGMVEKGIVVERLDYNKRYLQACSSSVLEHMANDVLSKSSFLAQNLPSFLNIVNEVKDSQMSTNVKFYRGSEGIKQVLWNELKADGEILAYSYRRLQEVVDVKFFLKWSKEVEMRGLVVKDLRSSEFLESARNVPALPFKGDIIRYIDPKDLGIPIELDIYNDTVVIFNWHEGDIYAVEIRDAKFAKMQKQIFNVFWEKAKEFTHEEWMEKLKSL